MKMMVLAAPLLLAQAGQPHSLQRPRLLYPPPPPPCNGCGVPHSYGLPPPPAPGFGQADRAPAYPNPRTSHTGGTKD